MAHHIYTPRINNNDDYVRIIDVLVAVGDRVTDGQPLAEVETDKASIVVESDQAGYVLRIDRPPDQMASVGSVLVWLGDNPDETPPDGDLEARRSASEKTVEPTAKARVLIAQRGLDAADIPATGERLTVADVQSYLAGQAETTTPAPTAGSRPSLPEPAGTLSPLSMEDRGMLRSVLWHRDEAVPSYLELQFQQEPWEEYAAAYAEQHRRLDNPLLPLMAHRLARIAGDHDKLNSTIIDEKRYTYEHVNLGFTIQVRKALYLVVVHEAEMKDQAGFVDALNRLHRNAIGGKLKPGDVSGATVAFSSMARWQVNRHLPILPPHVSLIVAHTVSKNGHAVIGATYDHRVLSGGDTAEILEQLVQTPDS